MSTQQQELHVEHRSRRSLVQWLLAGLLSVSLLGTMATTLPDALADHSSPVEQATELPLLAGCHSGGSCG